MLVYCLDCDHWFVEHAVDTEADLMECPFCEGSNLDAYPDDNLEAP